MAGCLRVLPLLTVVLLACCVTLSAFPDDVQGMTPLLAFNAELPKDPAAGNYTVIGGVAMSRPCCVSWGPNRVDCFIRGEQSNVYHWWKENGKLQENWIDLSGTIIGQLECVSRSPGTIDLIVQGANNVMYTAFYSGKWSSWKIQKGLIISEVPSCVARTESIINCVVRDRRNVVFSIDSVDGVWTKVEPRQGLLTSPMSISRRSEKEIDVFGIGSTKSLFQLTWRGRWPLRWRRVAVRYVHGTPTAVSWNANRIDVFVLGVKNQLLHLEWNGAWSKGYEDLGGVLQETPSCVLIEKNIHCFGIGSKSYLYRKSYVDGKWTDWMCAYGSFLERPSCVVSNVEEREVSCYARGFRREIVEVVYKL